MIYLLFAVPQCPHLKKRYHDCVEKVKEYLETVKDFDKLVSPQSLFLHFLGSKPSSKVWKNLEVVKKSECSFFFFFLVSSFMEAITSRDEVGEAGCLAGEWAEGGVTTGSSLDALPAFKCFLDRRPLTRPPFVFFSKASTSFYLLNLVVIPERKEKL